MEFVELDEEKRTVFFRKQGIELSPASLGKGFALDRAILISRKRGLRNVMLSGGFSSVFASGAPAWKDRWNLSIRNPMDRNRPYARIGLVNQGIPHRGRNSSVLLITVAFMGISSIHAQGVLFIIWRTSMSSLPQRRKRKRCQRRSTSWEWRKRSNSVISIQQSAWRS